MKKGDIINFMNPVLIILIILGCVVLWFLLFPLFTKLGDILTKKWDKTFNDYDEDEENDKEENGNE